MIHLLPRHAEAGRHLLARDSRAARDALPAAILAASDAETRLELALTFSELGVYDDTAVAVLRDAFSLDWTDPGAPYADDWSLRRGRIAMALSRLGDVEMAQTMFLSLGTAEPWEGCCHRRESTLRAVEMLIDRNTLDAWVSRFGASDDPIERASAQWARDHLDEGPEALPE